MTVFVADITPTKLLYKLIV